MLYSFILRFFITMVRSISFYNQADNTWGQAHLQGYFGILQAMREKDPEFMTIQTKNKTIANKTYLVPEFHVDRSKLITVGLPAVRDYILKLMIYKATGNLEAAQVLFEKLTTVPQELLEVNLLM